MKRLALFFTSPRRVEVREESLPQPAPGEVLVQTLCSAISAGTELLVYRGMAPREFLLDTALPALRGNFSYPLKYGYANAGRVAALGAGVPPSWEGALVFSFHPHESHFLAEPSDLFPLPEGNIPEQALFLPNLETALNLVMDGAPLMGEEVVVFGQGIVGLLTTGLLARMPLAALITLDLHPLRRRISAAAGATASLDPGAPDFLGEVGQLCMAAGGEGADLTIEVSGTPSGLEQAIAATGCGGRVVIGSWYGEKALSIKLGLAFHRSRIRLISSQVSTVDALLTARWTKSRRLGFAWKLLPSIQPRRFITHRVPFPRAAEAYRMLDENPGECLQVILTYS